MRLRVKPAMRSKAPPFGEGLSHRGLDPRSPANITTEVLRRRDYNQKKTPLLCVSVLIYGNKRMRLRVKPAMRGLPPLQTLHSTL